MIPDWLQYFWNSFGTTNNVQCDRISTPALCLLPIYFNKYKKRWEHPCKNIIFHIWESEIMKSVEGYVYLTFVLIYNFLDFWNVQNMRILISEFVSCSLGNSEVWKLELHKLGNYKFENLKMEKLKIGNLENWKSQAPLNIPTPTPAPTTFFGDTMSSVER